MNSLPSSPGLYVHVPFCRTKCPYCGFFSVPSDKLIPRWLDALKKEIKDYRGQFECFDSLYFGGGTPSVLGLGDLEEILDHLFESLKFVDDLEITIEANPCDINRQTLQGLKRMGLNRINLGVQSFNDSELNFLGRGHNAGDAVQALNLSRSCGFKNIGLDLIYGFEGQSIEIWRQSMSKAVSFEPEHISCYQLTFEKKTPFFRMMKEGAINPVGEEKEREFFLVTSDYMEGRGYAHYEISNFAKAERFYSRHNCKYWFHAPYLGLGPSAHSFRDSKRWWNISSLREYCKSLESGRSAVECEEDLDREQIRLEMISLGLRTNRGFNMDLVKDLPGIEIKIALLEESGLIKSVGKRIIPTKKGFLVADSLPLSFYP